MTSSSRPTRISDVLRNMLERSGLGERIAEVSVLPEWEDRVGHAIAAVTKPLRIANGTLFVSVRSSSWLTELRMMERPILERLNAGRGRGRVQRIRFLMADGGGPGNDAGKGA
jgi:predicted nucleic acid-binding Zn ribbon protein